jgi:transposase
MIRTLAFDGTGFWLMTKRLSKVKFKVWPSAKEALHPVAASHLWQLLTDDPHDPPMAKTQAILIA